MLSRKAAIITSRALRFVIAVVLAALMITACERITSPDPAACKAALQAEYLKGGGHFGAEPPLCEGLPKAQVQRFIQQIKEGE
jgi:hypothetical protein